MFNIIIKVLNILQPSVQLDALHTAIDTTSVTLLFLAKLIIAVLYTSQWRPIAVSHPFPMN